MKTLPMGGNVVAPDSDVREFVIVDFKKLPSLTPLILFKFSIFHFGNKVISIFGYLN